MTPTNRRKSQLDLEKNVPEMFISKQFSSSEDIKVTQITQSYLI